MKYDETLIKLSNDYDAFIFLTKRLIGWPENAKYKHFQKYHLFI